MLWSDGTRRCAPDEAEDPGGEALAARHGLGLLGCAIHGAWNFAAGTQTLTALLGEGMPVPAQGLFTGSAIAVMVVVWVAAVTMLVTVARRPAPPQAAVTPDVAPPAEG